MVAQLQPLIEGAIKERLEANDALKALQQAQLAREQTEGAVRPVLVRFRRAVRAGFGSTSKAHNELRDRRGHEIIQDDSRDNATGDMSGASVPATPSAKAPDISA